MRLWRSAMPKGMFLKSQGFASNLSDPAGTHTLESFCKATGRDYAHCGRPVPLADFVAYGQWFRSELGLAIEEQNVSRIDQRDDGFELIAGSELVKARKVVVAVGVEPFAYTPDELAGLPAALGTHASSHADPAALSGREVIIVGAGSSALELGGLMHEAGVNVRILARRDANWNSAPLCPPRPVLERLRRPESGLGPGWRLWFYMNMPSVFRRLPADVRLAKARNVLGPSGALWLRDRVEGKVPVLGGHTVTWAKPGNDRVRLGVFKNSAQQHLEMDADHVIAATGYQVDLDRLTFLPEGIRSQLATVGKTPAVGHDFQSSVPGLFFMGPLVAPTFGPLMRFVCGADFAARAAISRL
jgi:thioredoxin reductase